MQSNVHCSLQGLIEITAPIVAFHSFLVLGFVIIFDLGVLTQFEFLRFVTFWVIEFCYNLSFVPTWGFVFSCYLRFLVLTLFEYLIFFIFDFLSFVAIWVLWLFDILRFVTVSVFEICHNLSFWVVSQFESYLSFLIVRIPKSSRLCSMTLSTWWLFGSLASTGHMFNHYLIITAVSPEKYHLSP